MSKPNDPVRTYSAEIHKYEPKVSKFYIHHCQCSNIIRTCYLKNIFKLPNISRNEAELPVSAITCLQANKNQTANFGPTIITLQKTSMHLWENLFTELFRAASPESLLFQVSGSSRYRPLQLNLLETQI